MSTQLGSSAENRVSRVFAATSITPDNSKKIYPRITLRLTEKELAKLKNLSHGMNLSAYIRNCLFGADAAPHKLRSRVPIKDQEALAMVLGLLGQTHFANNLNQIAHQANCGSLLMDKETEDEIKLTCAHIAWMRVQLTEALGLKSTTK